MIDFNKFRALNWEFDFPPRDLTSCANWFHYKSPRLLDFKRYDLNIQPETDESLIEQEKISYLIQLRENIQKQTKHLEDDVIRQLGILIRRNQPVPPELKVDLTLKIV